ncbi:CPCC family cysteine-rich protein [Burkholderia perseverans]|uniref:CPCC family cysteine-rich protein n=1 Tax=Burkholderia perseverans TaxID=2615214 RepID=UPI001FEDD402|nr:CPCC family cysteine-rich protein [Burkholderia perseverans]
MIKEKTDIFHCPCCGDFIFDHCGEYEICDICGWEDDPVQYNDPDFSGGANRYSLKEARAIWQRKIKRGDGDF